MGDIRNLQIKLENNLLSKNLNVKKIDQLNIETLKDFINHFDDFFLLCEGVKGDACGVLTACPPSKNIEEDKLCLGFFEDQKLIMFIDIIKNYPSDKVMTIGYLLVLPQKRSSGLGSLLMKNIMEWSKEQGFLKLRLGVQLQNERALAFWQKNNFEIKNTIKEKTEIKENLTYVLEYTL